MAKKQTFTLTLNIDTPEMGQELNKAIANLQIAMVQAEGCKMPSASEAVKYMILNQNK